MIDLLDCGDTPTGTDIIAKINEIIAVTNTVIDLPFSAWQALSITGTGYTGSLEYRTNMDYVELRGNVAYSGTDFVNRDIATLPIGARPAVAKYDVAKQKEGISGLPTPAVYVIEIATDGIVRAFNGVTDTHEIYFNNVRFDL